MLRVQCIIFMLAILPVFMSCGKSSEHIVHKQPVPSDEPADSVKLVSGANQADTATPANEKQPALPPAIQKSQLEFVQALLDSGAKIYMMDNVGGAAMIYTTNNRQKETLTDLIHATGWTELSLAANEGKTGRVKALLDEGAKPNRIDRGGYTALTRAITEGKTKTVKLLLEKGADPNRMDKTGQTPLTTAMRDGSPKLVKTLLDGGADVDSRSKSGTTALIEAARIGRTDIVKLLLNRGANANAKDRDGRTALHEAARKRGRPEIVKALLEGGMKRSAKREKNASARAKAKKAPQKTIAKASRAEQEGGAIPDAKKVDDWNPLMPSDAAEKVEASVSSEKTEQKIRTNARTDAKHRKRQGLAEIARPIRQKGANPNATDRHGQSALDEALRFQNVEIVKLLLDAGAKPDTEHLSQAVRYRNIEIVNALLNAGAKPGAEHLSRAIRNYQIDISTALRAEGIKPDFEERQETYRHRRDSVPEMVTALLNKIAPNTKDKRKKGKTAFMYAVEWGDSEIIERMLDKGADVNARCMGGYTALMMAHSAETVHFLLDAGADPRARNDKGHSALRILARKKGSAEAVETLLEALSEEGVDAKELSDALGAATVNRCTETVDILLAAGARPDMSSKGWDKNGLAHRMMKRHTRTRRPSR